MRTLDFSSWQALLSTLLAITVISLIGVSVRLIAMQKVQQRRERENRQINERLRTLIAAYKTLGGSFTGDLAVNPLHLRDMRRAPETEGDTESSSSDRSRRIRDAVEAALSDIILLGTEQQVKLAAKAAADLAARRPAHMAELVVSLRDFIRRVLDLDAIPGDVVIPNQGPARPASTRGGGSGKGDGGGKGEGAGKGGGGAGAGTGMRLDGGVAADGPAARDP